MKITELLARVPLFEGLSPGDRMNIRDATSIRYYRRGEKIVSQGEAGDAFFVIVRGRVGVSVLSPEGREVVLSTLGDGDHFGEMALVDDQPRSATVAATEKSELAVLTRDAFLGLLQSNFSLTRAILASFSRRLRTANATIEGLASLDVKGRLARYFHDLAEARGRKAGGGWTVVVRPSQREIADTIGSSRETVSRTMTLMAREGLIVPKGRVVYVKFEGEGSPQRPQGLSATKL
jgi:CRP/FNR family cyclic AMP-dependent transcriptional regulator